MQGITHNHSQVARGPSHLRQEAFWPPVSHFFPGHTTEKLFRMSLKPQVLTHSLTLWNSSNKLGPLLCGASQFTVKEYVDE